MLLGTLAISVVAVGLISCGGSKTSNVPAPAGAAPFSGETVFPCQVFDDDEWFMARGIASGSRAQVDAVTRLALTYAQDNIRQKMSHVFMGQVDLFSGHLGGSQGTDIFRNTENGGKQIIDAKVSNSYMTCEKHSGVNDKGHIEAYVAVRIRKADVANELSDMVEKMVSEDEELKIRFRESEFRKRLAETFKQFRGN